MSEKYTSFRIREKTLQKVRAYCKAEGLMLHFFIRKAIENELKKQRKRGEEG